MSNTPKMDTFTFRIESDLKADFVKLVESQNKPAGEILRGFIRELVSSKRQNEFLKQARLQSKVIATAANSSNSDEAEVLRHLDREFDELSQRADWQ